MAFVADDTMLITERPGRIRVIRNGVLDPEPVRGVPEVRAQGLSGIRPRAAPGLRQQPLTCT
jgi:aldose sugar dehydrogenase